MGEFYARMSAPRTGFEPGGRLKDCNDEGCATFKAPLPLTFRSILLNRLALRISQMSEVVALELVVKRAL